MSAAGWRSQIKVIGHVTLAVLKVNKVNVNMPV